MGYTITHTDNKGRERTFWCPQKCPQQLCCPRYAPKNSLIDAHFLFYYRGCCSVINNCCTFRLFSNIYTFSLKTGGNLCGRFAQSQTREEYLAYLADEAERDIAYDPEPIGRYNVAPGTKVLLLSERNGQLHLDPVHWGYAPGWWDKPPLINARVETTATSKMFKLLWQHGSLFSAPTTGENE